MHRALLLALLASTAWADPAEFTKGISTTSVYVTNTTGVVSATNIYGKNVSGTTGAFGSVAGTLSTAAQPNITSLGTLTGLTVSGQVTSTILSSTVIYGSTVSGTQLFVGNASCASVGIGIGATNTGWCRPTSGQVAFMAAGTANNYFGAAGQAIGTSTLPATASLTVVGPISASQVNAPLVSLTMPTGTVTATNINGRYISATAFYGDGSNLTGISGGGSGDRITSGTTSAVALSAASTISVTAGGQNVMNIQSQTTTVSGNLITSGLHVSGTMTNGTVSSTASTSTTVADWSMSRDYEWAITSSTTIMFTNPPASGKREWMTLTLTEPSPSIAVTLPTARWPFGISPSITTSSTGNVKHVIQCSTSDGGANYNCTYPGPNMQ